MMRQARHAFALLKGALGEVHASEGRTVPDERLSLDAMFVWSTMHGLAGIMSGSALGHLGLSSRVVATTPEHTLAMIGTGLNGARDAA